MVSRAKYLKIKIAIISSNVLSKRKPSRPLQRKQFPEMASSPLDSSIIFIRPEKMLENVS